jgi:hypothetical protein
MLATIQAIAAMLAAYSAMNTGNNGPSAQNTAYIRY